MLIGAFQVPEIGGMLVEDVGNIGAILFCHKGAMAAKVGVKPLPTFTVSVCVKAQVSVSVL